VAALAAVLLAFTGVIASVAGFRTSDSAAVHALVTAPFPLAVVAAALSFHFRRQHPGARRRQAAIPRGDVAGTPGEDATSDPLATRVSCSGEGRCDLLVMGRAANRGEDRRALVRLPRASFWKLPVPS
jgi:hypothetical protein